MSKRFQVQAFATVSITINGVNADSEADAANIVRSMSLYHVLSRPNLAIELPFGMVRHIAAASANVEAVNVVESRRTVPGASMPSTQRFVFNDAERKLQALQLANQFYAELLDSCETLSAIADEHGSVTLAHLMHLHAAILSGSFVDIDMPYESSVLDIVNELPSWKTWREYIVPNV